MKIRVYLVEFKEQREVIAATSSHGACRALNWPPSRCRVKDITRRTLQPHHMLPLKGDTHAD